MEFNFSFRQAAINVFSSIENWRIDSCLRKELTLDTNKVYNKSLIIDIDRYKDEVEIPVIARGLYEMIISEEIYDPAPKKIEKIILPLYENCMEQSRRTFDSIIKQLFTNVDYSKRLQKIITSKGEVCYGGRGIILDSDYTPLLLCTLMARKYKVEEDTYMTYYRPVCHINPKVFTDTDKMVNKGIVKKLIPFYTTNDMYFSFVSDRFASSNPDDRKVKVIVDNFDDFFVEPIKPSPSFCTNDILNECLINNIDDVLRLV